VPSDRENCTRLSPIVLPIRGGYFGVNLDPNSTSSKASGSGQGQKLEAIARLSGQGFRGSGRSGYRVEPYLFHRLGVGWFTGSGLSAGRVGVGWLGWLFNCEGLRVRECPK